MEEIYFKQEERKKMENFLLRFLSFYFEALKKENQKTIQELLNSAGDAKNFQQILSNSFDSKTTHEIIRAFLQSEKDTYIFFEDIGDFISDLRNYLQDPKFLEEVINNFKRILRDLNNK